MASRRDVKLLVVILWISCFQESCGLQCWRRCMTILKQDLLKCQVVCGAKQKISVGFVRNRRSVMNTTTVKTLRSLVQPEKKYDCSRNEYLDENHGIVNSDASNVSVKFSLYRNKTVARITWDAPQECLRKQEKCRGYLVRWVFFPNYQDLYCREIDDPNRRYFTLNQDTGFDGIKSFGVDVKAFLFATDNLHIIRITPPPPGSLTVPRTMYVPTHNDAPTSDKLSTVVFNTENTDKSQTWEQSHGTFTNQKRFTPHSHNAQSEGVSRGYKTTITVSLTLFIVFAMSMFCLVTGWVYKKHVQKHNNIPVHRPSFMKVIKGTHYISYLPEKSTTSQVLGICSWLASHDIDVVMDRLYDPKLYNSLGPKRFGETFVAKAEKVIMIITPEYQRLCWLDDIMDINSKLTLNSLDLERLYSEVKYIKNELSTTMNRSSDRFVPVLLNVPDGHLPMWLNKLTTVTWPEDAKSDKFLKLLKGESCVVNKSFEAGRPIDIV